MRSLLAVLLLASGAAAAPVTVTVYHTNDVHGWIMSRPEKDHPERLVGGAPALAALVGKDKGPKLLLDAGDWWQGTPEGSLSKGASVAEVFNAVGYDAVVVGNHEYDAGQEALKALVPVFKAPVLSANTRDAKTGERVPWLRPWVIKEVAGIKFGVFGLTTTKMDKLAFPKNIAGLAFRREADEAKDAVAELKKAGADVIVALTHVGYEEEGKPPYEGDQTLAREVAGIDLIVGGHSHTPLFKAYRDPTHGTLIVQAGSYLTRVGKATLVFEGHRLVSSSDELLELKPELTGEDAAVKAVVARHQEAVGKAFEVVVATAAAALERGAGDKESPLGSWMADCYKDWSGLDAALQNGGGIRADLPAGPVTLRRLFNVMPFDNAVVKLRLKGSLLRSALEHGVGAARLVQVGGVEAEYRRGKPKGGRLAAVKVGGARLDDARVYGVAVLDFLVMGGDGYDEFAQADASEPTGVLARDVLRLCAEKQKTIAPPPTGRLKARED